MLTLRALSIGRVPYSPLGRGFLTGEIKAFEDIPEGDYRRTDPRYQGENSGKNRALVEVVKEIGRLNTPRPVRLRWPGCWRKGRTLSLSPAPSV